MHMILNPPADTAGQGRPRTRGPSVAADSLRLTDAAPAHPHFHSAFRSAMNYAALITAIAGAHGQATALAKLAFTPHWRIMMPS